jgi:Tol biopolymer transport system component
VKLVKKVEGLVFRNLSWKYDGSVLTFSNYDSNKLFWQLFKISPDGSNLVNIYPADAQCNYPAWSTNGRLAYFYAGREHMNEIRIDGNDFFYKENCNQSRPAWSPDCKSLVISVQDLSSQGSLYKVSLLDIAVTPLLKAKGKWNEEIYYQPIYSPDGKQIAFVKWGSLLGDNQEIWIMNADGSDPKKLTSGNIDLSPAWSPDGQYIAFCRYIDVRMGISKMFIISLNDSSITQVIENDASCLTWIQ